MEPNDDQLIQRINQGDNSAFAPLVDRYSSQIYNLMYRYTSSTDDAADLTQDVFCKAFERLDNYRDDRRFFSWLYTLALNHAKDWSRRRTNDQRKIRQLAREPQPDTAIRPCNLETGETHKALERALACLSGDNREMVLLKYQHDVTVQELSEIFKLSASAVKMRLHRSLAEIRQHLGDECNGQTGTANQA